VRTPEERVAQARTFDRAAVEYEAGRPEYPPELAEWWASLGAFPPGGRVLDLAAGTGKLTRALVGRGASIVAVEPSANMRAQLTTVPALVDVPVLEGTAESIPLPDDSVDAVVVGQAFHWFDAPAALASIARVLRPGGGLGLAWNDDDLAGAPDWVCLEHERKESIGGGNIGLGVVLSSAAVHASSLFEPLESAEFRSVQRVTPAQALDSLASRSYIIAMDEPSRSALLDEVRAALPSAEVIDHPLVTRAFWARRR